MTPPPKSLFVDRRAAPARPADPVGSAAPVGVSADFMVAAVLVPLAVPGLYDYHVPPAQPLAAGDFVLVPFGAKKISGIVWHAPRPWQAGDMPQAKLKTILRRHDCPPLSAQTRKFIDRVANYVMASQGMVLRMLMRVPAAFEPPAPVQAWRDGGKRPPKMTPAREKVYAALAALAGDKIDKNNSAALPPADLARAASVSPNVVRGLIKAGALEAVDLAGDAPFSRPRPQTRQLQFSPAQETAVNDLCDAVQAKNFQPYLLDGVTGSGKTEVYFEALAATLAQGRKALVLLPEISLTAQFITRFEKRFGCAPALWHSGLSAGARRRTWRAVAEGQVSVLAGARSALFLPWDELGLIIVDEEHDGGFKQEEGVIYNARDMAVLRAQLADATIILSSATPTLETIVNVQNGRYKQLRLPMRHSGAVMPPIELVDMRRHQPPRKTDEAGSRWLAAPLVKAVEKTLDDKTQSLLFLNRRGYAPLTLCRVCGYRYACENCDSWLVEHRFRRELICHYCGTMRPAPTQCENCEQADTLAACGPGIERIMEEVTQIFPKARLAVLSSDLIPNTAALRETLARIIAGEIDIIIGTQIIAKGHHFPKLAFVGVVDADLGLGNSDLRAGERTFQILLQVAGRAGREQIPGHAQLQTYMPDHPVLQALASGDRDAFLAREMDMRQAANMPPFGRLAGIILSGPALPPLRQFASALAAQVPPHEQIEVLGPAPAPIARIRNHYRLRFLVKGKKTAPLQNFIKTWLGRVKCPPKIRTTIDIDPYRFL